jgi:putative redox protein
MASAKVVWNRGLQFVGISGSNHTAIADTSLEAGGFNAAPTPTELLLIAQGACSGMDVISILKKKRVEFDDFQIEVDGEIEQGPPKFVKKIHLIYKIWGQDISEEALKRSIELSLEKYCTVANSLKGRVAITYEYLINPAAV